MVWSAIANFGSKLVQGFQAGRSVGQVAGQSFSQTYKTAGLWKGIKAFGADLKPAYQLLTPAQQGALKTTALTAAALPVAKGLFFPGGGQVPQGGGYPGQY